MVLESVTSLSPSCCRLSQVPFRGGGEEELASLPQFNEHISKRKVAHVSISGRSFTVERAANFGHMTCSFHSGWSCTMIDWFLGT